MSVSTVKLTKSDIFETRQCQLLSSVSSDTSSSEYNGDLEVTGTT